MVTMTAVLVLCTIYLHHVLVDGTSFQKTTSAAGIRRFIFVAVAKNESEMRTDTFKRPRGLQSKRFTTNWTLKDVRNELLQVD